MEERASRGVDVALFAAIDDYDGRRGGGTSPTSGVCSLAAVKWMVRRRVFSFGGRAGGTGEAVRMGRMGVVVVVDIVLQIARQIRMFCACCCG